MMPADQEEQIYDVSDVYRVTVNEPLGLEADISMFEEPLILSPTQEQMGPPEEIGPPAPAASEFPWGLLLIAGLAFLLLRKK